MTEVPCNRSVLETLMMVLLGLGGSELTLLAENLEQVIHGMRGATVSGGAIVDGAGRLEVADVLEVTGADRAAAGIDVTEAIHGRGDE